MNGTVWSICKMNMILHNITDAHIENDDTLENPMLVKNDYVQLFDRVVANPPFSQNYTIAGMKYKQRFHYGFTPEETGKKADLMFVQHMIASLKPKGKMATVMPHGACFFAAGWKRPFARELSTMGLSKRSLVCRQTYFMAQVFPRVCWSSTRISRVKSAGKILFINADAEFGEDEGTKLLASEDWKRSRRSIVTGVRSPRYSRMVPLKEIIDNQYNLNIRRYVDNAPPPEIQDVRAHLVGGIPKREVKRYSEQLAELSGLKEAVVFIPKDKDYLQFKPEVESKAHIRPIMEAQRP